MPIGWTVRAITRAILPVLLVFTLVRLGSSLVPGSFEVRLFRYPSLLVLTPVTIGTAGNLGSILTTRLSMSFHLGTLSFSPRDNKPTGNVITTLALAVTVFPVIGAGAWIATLLVPGDTSLALQKAVLVALLSGISLVIFAVVMTFSATYLAYRFDLDPDDVVIPVVTNLYDVLGVVVLFKMAQVLA